MLVQVEYDSPASFSNNSPMTILRLTRVSQVILYWDFFTFGLIRIASYLKYDHSLDTYRRILFRLARQPMTSWLAVALDDDETPVGFFVAYDCTPLFAATREFEVSVFYHLPGRKDAIVALQTSLDSFCSSSNVSHYYVTTCRKSGSSTRVFGEEWCGLKRAYTVFKRKVK
jgi:hypothetical protein